MTLFLFETAESGDYLKARVHVTQFPKRLF